MAVSWSLEVAQFVATSMVPFIALPVLGVMSTEDMAKQYLSKVVLDKFLNFVFVLVVREATSLYTRFAFLMLRHFGTRVRSLLLSFLMLTLVLVQATDSGVAALVVVFTVEKVIGEIQNDIIREEQFKVFTHMFVLKRA
ncbi:unnamed protein product [Ixodes hexagonus]